jgi:predicted Zn-dependent peptidase
VTLNKDRKSEQDTRRTPEDPLDFARSLPNLHPPCTLKKVLIRRTPTMQAKALRWAILFCLPAFAAAQDLAQFEKRLTRFTLPNGMRFLVLERHEAPVVSFDLLVNAGAVNDPAGESSMAHMFEHMIGKGTRAVGTTNWAKENEALAKVEKIYDQLEEQRRRGAAGAEKARQLETELKAAIEQANGFVEPNAFPRLIEEQGGVGFNAGTSQDYTTYFYSLPSNKMELWFLLQSEWLRRPVFREFYKERDVVREERRMRVESSSQGKLMELLLGTSFIAFPYRNLIGWASEIESLRASEAERFFRTYYVPGNVVVSIVGDVDPVRAKQLAEKYYGSIPAGPMPPPVSIVEPRQEGAKRVELITEAQPVVMMGYKRPSQYDKDDPVFDVIQGILSMGRTGWIYQDLVRDKKIAIGAGAYGNFPGSKYPNLFIFLSVPANGHTVDENEKALYDLIDRLKNEKVDEQTLKRVQTNVRAGLIRQLNSNSGLASQLTVYEATYGDWHKMFTAIDEINKVTADDVQRVARQYFVEAGRTVAYTKTGKLPEPKEVKQGLAAPPNQEPSRDREGAEVRAHTEPATVNGADRSSSLLAPRSSILSATSNGGAQ